MLTRTPLTWPVRTRRRPIFAWRERLEGVIASVQPVAQPVVQPVGPPVGVALPSPLAEELGVDGAGVLGVVVGFALPVGAVVGEVEGAVEPVDGPVEGVLGALGVEAESDGVEGIELGDELLDPDGVGDGESGFCDGVVPSCVPLPPEFPVAGWSCEPPLWPGSLVNTLLW